MTLELSIDEIAHLAHCAEKMRNLAERSRIIAEALDIDPIGRAKLARITQKITWQAEKYLHGEPATSTLVIV